MKVNWRGLHVKGERYRRRDEINLDSLEEIMIKAERRHLHTRIFGLMTE